MPGEYQVVFDSAPVLHISRITLIALIHNLVSRPGRSELSHPYIAREAGVLLVRVFAVPFRVGGGLISQGYCIHPHPVEFSVSA